LTAVTALTAHNLPAKARLPVVASARQGAGALLFAAVVGAPLCFGSTDTTTTALWCMVLGAAVALVPVKDVAPRHVAVFLGAVAIIVGGYGFVLHEQLAQEPWIAPPDAIWTKAADLLDTPVVASAAVTRHQPLLSIGNSLACLLALICGFMLGADRAFARRLLRVIAFSGAAVAVYGIVSYAVDPTHILWREKASYRDVLTATFVNRNTAAVYFGSCAVIWLIFLSEIMREWRGCGSRWPQLLGDLLHAFDRRAIGFFAALFVCLAAMFMTASRAGTAFSLLGLAVASAFLFRRSLSYRRGTIAGLAIAVVVGLMLLQIMGAGVLGRINVEGLAEGGRVRTYAATLKMIGDHPWLGVGLGNFGWSYPAYRGDDISIWGVWDRAHSTPLELAAELGLPLAIIIYVGWLIAFAVLARGIWKRQHIPSATLAAFCVAMIAVLHSAIDFSLQDPGFSIPVFALLGAGIIQSSRPRSHFFSSVNKNESNGSGAIRS
jgi:O-antigen ligase